MRRSIFIATLFTFFATGTYAGQQQFDYAGVNSCMKCHRKVWRSWNKNVKAKALEILKPGERAEAKKQSGLDPQKDYSKDPSCLPCHTVGYGKAGGFVSLEKTPDRAGVGCESCHGPGKEYNKIMKRHSRTYKVEQLIAKGLIAEPHTACIECHNEKSPTHKLAAPLDFKEIEWPGHDPVKLKYHTPEYQQNK